MHYIWKKNNPEELYDLSVDPGEVNNIASTTDGIQQINYFREKLKNFKKGN
jgi:hypothetical protein